MGLSVARDVRDVPINLSYQEANELLKVFKKLDKDKDGHISTQDLRKALTEMGEKVTDDELRDLIAEVDINKNCTIEEEEFLQVHRGWLGSAWCRSSFGVWFAKLEFVHACTRLCIWYLWELTFVNFFLVDECYKVR